MNGTVKIPEGASRSQTQQQWLEHVTELDSNIAQSVSDIISDNSAEFVSVFYSTLLDDEEAAPFLSHNMVNERLSHSLQKWLLRLFCDQPEDVETFAREQQAIGVAHARMQIPIHLVMQGARLLKGAIIRHLARTTLERDALVEAMIYVGALIDIAVALMNQAFVKDTRRGAQTDEAYRIFALGQDISLERETQRAALLEWSQGVLFSLYSHPPGAPLPSLGSSDFGLWLHHKAGIMFQGASALDEIRASMREVDQLLLPAIVRARHADSPTVARQLEELQNKITEMKYLLSSLFQAAAALENGRDPLTRALNRRFLPSILSREVTLAAQSDSSFSLVMIDVDHFKEVNDRFGHSGGDVVLAQVAETIQESCRMGDFIFRYGGEEFLIALVETDSAKALQVADRIRRDLEAKEIRLADGSSLRVTLSAGIATFNGHPDYTHLVNAADLALYRAKRAGRNRCVLAEEPA
ncbi:GGDEF domain-containing protein [Roseomonas marmotae]|uniref:Diguanylate cyclase DosC n=2 Tax=Roseomonas marmotae TaxID=2768161 RepID=A0ABS3KEU8_9PROT|nr:GGDEF domain-containing protein [Roseomonas marmotae]MBO1075183.1 GGDEF domain-containing protein [Roseomonas marmotae]QTI79708.1 GGDEF domain-containing protein [Roseomonas marmotae]